MPLFKSIFKIVLAFFVVAISAVAANAGYTAALNRHYFDVKEVAMHNVHILPKSEIEKLMGKVMGQNIFELDLEEIGRKIESHPWISDVQIKRDIPSRLTVIVKEREPVALAKIGRTLWLVDGEGVQLKTVTNRSRFSMPIIDGMSGGRKMGDLVDTSKMRIANEVLEQMKGYRLFGLSAIDRIDVGQKDLARIYFKDASIVVITPDHDWNDELERLLTVDYILRKNGNKNGIDSINLRFADRVIVSYKQTKKRVK